MKEISKEKFGLLYDKLSEHLEKNGGVMKTVGIEQGTAHQELSRMWQEGKKWETIVLIIAYHYSRTDSLLLKLPGSTSLIGQGKSFSEIQRILGIKDKDEECVIGRDEFEEEFSNLWGMFRGVTGIGTLLDGLGIKAGKSILVNYWKQDYKWEVITAIVVLMRMETSKTIKVETEFGIFRFKSSDCYGVLETLQNAGK